MSTLNENVKKSIEGENIEIKPRPLRYVVMPLTKLDETYAIDSFETADINDAMARVNNNIKNGLGDWVIMTALDDVRRQ